MPGHARAPTRAQGTGPIDVRDFSRSEGFPRTGYLVPARDAPGVLPDGESCWDVAVVVAAVSCHLEIQVDILAGELYLDFFIWF